MENLEREEVIKRLRASIHHLKASVSSYMEGVEKLHSQAEDLSHDFDAFMEAYKHEKGNG